MRRTELLPRKADQGGGSREQGSGSRDQGAGIREQGAGSREQGAGSREQGAGSREQGAGSREQGSASISTLYPLPSTLYPIASHRPTRRLPGIVDSAIRDYSSTRFMTIAPGVTIAAVPYLREVVWQRRKAALWSLIPRGLEGITKIEDQFYVVNSTGLSRVRPRKFLFLEESPDANHVRATKDVFGM